MRAATSSSTAPRLRAPQRTAVLGALAAALALSVAACSSSPSSTATTASGSTSSSAGGAAAGNGGGTAAQLNALSSQVQAGEHSTFKAAYSVQSAGKSQTITVEQKPPKSVLSTDSGSVINDGTKTYFCSSSGGTQSCLAASGTNPLAALTAIFDPHTVLGVLQGAAAQAEAHAAGYSVSFSSASYAGQDAKCVTYSGAGQTGKDCVTTAGLLAYVQAGGDTVTLTSLSSSPPDSDFGLPAGATVVTEPSIP